MSGYSVARRVLVCSFCTSLNAWADSAPVMVAKPNAAVSATVEVPSATPTATVQPQTSTAVPRFVELVPARYNTDEIRVATGQDLKFTVVVEHPAGLPIVLDALGLPKGASFDSESHAFSWRPTDTDRGTYQVRLRAAAGGTEVSRILSITVAGNQPPSIGTSWFEAVAGEAGHWSIGAKDPDGAPVVVTARNLPKGATIDADGNLSFHPTLEQVGNYEFELSASNGVQTTTTQGYFSVRPAGDAKTELQEWESFWLPGAGYALYTPRDSAAGDLFHGVSLEIVMAAWIHRNDNRGPSHGRVYVTAELLNSDVEDAPLLFNYGLGLSLSFERNPERSWLIPFYDIEFGGMLHKEIGGLFQTTPHLGLHLFSNPNVFISGRAGYRLVPSRIDTLGGLHAALTADVTIW